MIPSSEPVLWLSEADVVAMMDVAGAISALEAGLLAEARGEAQNMVKTHVEWSDGGTLHAIGAAFPKTGFVGTKTWSHTKGGATPLLILFDSTNGSLRAILEAFALGQMRTAAASGVATRWLAASDAAEFALIGTGKQAITQVAAVLAVRPVRRVRVFSRDENRRAQFAVRVSKEFSVEAVASSSVREAVKGASIITLVTRATDPILSSDMADRGAHINSVGAIVPSRAEVARDVIARAAQIVTDSVPQAQKLSRELIEFFGSDPEKWRLVRSLASAVASRRSRAAGDDLTLFKSLGVGISDLSLGIELYRKALALGLGSKIPQPQKALPQFDAKRAASALRGGG